MNATDADGYDDDGDGYDDDGDGYDDDGDGHDDDGDGDNNDGGTTSCDPRGEFSQPTQIEYHHIIFLFIYIGYILYHNKTDKLSHLGGQGTYIGKGEDKPLRKKLR